MRRCSRTQCRGRAFTLLFVLLMAAGCGGATGTTGGAVGGVTPTATAAPPPATALVTATGLPPTAPAPPASTNTPLAPTATAPPPTRTPVPPTATPLPVLVETRNIVTTKSSSGQPVIIGEIANVGQGEVGELKVILAVIDGAGKTVAVPIAVIAVESLAPGEKTVWQATVAEKIDVGAIKEVQAQAQATRASVSLRDRLYKEVKVEGVSFSSRAGQPPTVWANGRVLNTGTASATVGVWMAAYGADSKLTHVAADNATRLAQLAPGKEQPFVIELSGSSDAPVKYEFWVRASKRDAAFSATIVDLQAQKVQVVRSSGAAPLVVGEFVNPGNADVAGFNVAIAFIDEGGKTVGVGSGSLAANLLTPGERTVFKSSFFSGMTDKTAYKDVRVQAQAMVASDATKWTSARDLRVEGESIAPTGGVGSYVRVNGQVANKGTQPTQSAVVYIAIYGADGALLMVEQGFSPAGGQIPAGGSVPFTINLITLKELPAKYEFFISATR